MSKSSKNPTLSVALFILFIFIALAASFAPATNPKVSIQTSLGEIVIELNLEAAPVSVDNFIHYVEDGFYDGIIFHRVIKDFMIQTGGHKLDMTKKTPSRPSIVNESSNGLKNLKYSVAMARTRIPDSATSQFFINHKNNAFLDAQKGRPGYAVFGQVIKGMDVVEKIANSKTKNLERYGNVPVKPISIISARVIKEIPYLSLLKDWVEKEQPKPTL